MYKDTLGQDVCIGDTVAFMTYGTLYKSKLLKVSEKGNATIESPFGEKTVSRQWCKISEQ